MSINRIAIIGTAESWMQTPWDDPDLQCYSLNDAYRRKGFVRADAWYDFHPPNRFFYPPQGTDQPVFAHQVPAGYYCRPPSHLAWLAKQMIPVWLHPEWRTQDPGSMVPTEAQEGYAALLQKPQAQAFPRAAIEAHFGRYFTSSPQWMMAHGILQGCRDFAIYGIHLATEQEYVDQRPGFEFLIGRVLGCSKVTVTITDGMRHYVSQDGAIHLPVASPVLSSDYQYAFQPRPRAALDPIKWELHKAQVKQARAIHQLRDAKWWQRRKAAQDALWHAEAVIADLQEQMARLQMPKGLVEHA